MEKQILWNGHTDYIDDLMVEKTFRRKLFGLYKLPLIYFWYNPTTKRLYIGKTTNVHSRIKHYLKAFLYKNWDAHKQNESLVQEVREYGLKNYIFGILFQSKNRLEIKKTEFNAVFTIAGSPVNIDQLEHTTMQHNKVNNGLNLYNDDFKQHLVHEGLISCIENGIVPMKLPCKAIPK